MIGYGLSVIGILGFTAFLITYTDNLWWVLLGIVLLPQSVYLKNKE